MAQVVIISIAGEELGWESKSCQLFVSTTPLTFLSRNVNIPWPSQGMGDGDYMFAFQYLVMPIASEFNPDLVISEYDVGNDKT